MIQIGDMLVNPAHVALAERDASGIVTVYFAVPVRRPGEAFAAALTVTLSDPEAAHLWSLLTFSGKGA